MEDLDFIQRISNQVNIKSLGLPLYTSGRSWDKKNIIRKALDSAKLRKRWSNGENSRKLSQEYYKT